MTSKAAIREAVARSLVRYSYGAFEDQRLDLNGDRMYPAFTPSEHCLKAADAAMAALDAVSTSQKHEATMTDNEKLAQNYDAEVVRLAQLRKLRAERDLKKHPSRFMWVDVDFLLEEIDARDAEIERLRQRIKL